MLPVRVPSPDARRYTAGATKRSATTATISNAALPTTMVIVTSSLGAQKAVVPMRILSATSEGLFTPRTGEDLCGCASQRACLLDIFVEEHSKDVRVLPVPSKVV